MPSGLGFQQAAHPGTALPQRLAGSKPTRRLLRRTVRCPPGSVCVGQAGACREQVSGTLLGGGLWRKAPPPHFKAGCVWAGKGYLQADSPCALRNVKGRATISSWDGAESCCGLVAMAHASWQRLKGKWCWGQACWQARKQDVPGDGRHGRRRRDVFLPTKDPAVLLINTTSSRTAKLLCFYY